MNSDKSIVEFLCRDENISLAFDVAAAIDDVDAEIQRRFLDTVYVGLAEKFSAARLSNWILEKPRVYDASKAHRYASIYLDPRRFDKTSYLCYPLNVSREGKELSLYYGLEWAGKIEKEPKGFPTQESLPLIAYLADSEFERNAWNLGLKTLGRFMSRKELILALHQRKAELVESAIEDFWSFVENTVEMVQVTNESLRKLSKTK